MTTNNIEKSLSGKEEHVETSSVLSNMKSLPAETVEPKGDYSGASEKTDPAEIKLVRKLDMRIMVSTVCKGYILLLTNLQPILWAMYFLNYLDRNALPQARLNTLEKDLNLKGVEYNTAISILFVGYILMQGEDSIETVSFCLTCP